MHVADVDCNRLRQTVLQQHANSSRCKSIESPRAGHYNVPQPDARRIAWARLIFDCSGGPEHFQELSEERR
jgi:hypothetical protein